MVPYLARVDMHPLCTYLAELSYLHHRSYLEVLIIVHVMQRMSGPAPTYIAMQATRKPLRDLITTHVRRSLLLRRKHMHLVIANAGASGRIGTHQ